MRVNGNCSHKLILLSHKNRYELIQCIGVCELLTCPCALRTNVFKRFASIKSYYVVFFSDPEASYYQVNRTLTQIPNWIKVLLVELSSRIEHVFTEGSDRPSTYLLTSLVHYFNKSTANFRFCELIINDGAVSNE